METKSLVKRSTQKLQTVDLPNEFIKWLVQEERIPEHGITQKTYRRVIARFQDFLKDNQVTEPDMNTINLYVQMLKQNLKPATINSYLVPLRLFFRFLHEKGFYPNDIFKKKLVKVKKTKGAKTHSREWLRPEWLQKMTYFTDDTLKGKRDKAIMLTMFYSGLRCKELSGLQNGDIIFLDNRIQLKILGKGRTDYEFVDTHPEAVEAITEYQRELKKQTSIDDNNPLFISMSWNGYFGNRLTEISISRTIKKYIKKLNLPEKLQNKLCAHSLRHGFVTVGLLRGVPERIMQGWARHQSLDTTLGYAHDITADNLWNDYSKTFDTLTNLVEDMNNGETQKRRADSSASAA